MVPPVSERHRGRDGARQGAAQGLDPPLARRHHDHGRGHWPPDHHHRPPSDARGGRARHQPDHGEGRHGVCPEQAVGQGHCHQRRRPHRGSARLRPHQGRHDQDAVVSFVSQGLVEI